MGPTHIGERLGDIDTMSRILDNEEPTGPAVQGRCSTLRASQYWPCQHLDEVLELFQLIDPSINRSCNKDHHDAYKRVYACVNALLYALT